MRDRHIAFAVLMRAPGAMLVAAFALAACVPIRQEVVAREAARAAVRPILADRFPGVPLEPYADCVIDNATLEELNALARTRLTGLEVTSVGTITDIATRPATLACMAEAGRAVPLAGR